MISHLRIRDVDPGFVKFDLHRFDCVARHLRIIGAVYPVVGAENDCTVAQLRYEIGGAGVERTPF